MKIFRCLEIPLFSIKRLKISYFDQKAKINPFQKMDAMKKVRSGIDRMFEKSLQDLVRLVRNNKHREKEFINEALEGKLVEFLFFLDFCRFFPKQSA